MSRIKNLLKKILNDLDSNHPEILQSEIGVLFCDDTFIHELNLSYRHKDKPTDVLSFSAVEQSSDFIEGAYLGDLVISLPTTRRQARQYKVTFNEELLRLLIHGTLHLFGYDHENVSKTEAARMRRREQQLFSRYREDLP